MRLIISIAIFLILKNINAIGQTWTPIIKDKEIIIKGFIDDEQLKKYPDSAVEVNVSVSTFPSGMVMDNFITYKTSVRNLENFKFIIPITQQRLFMRIDYNSLNSLFYWSGHENIYILEPGDNIECILTSKYFYFKGKGSEKLNCQSEIYNHRNKNRNLQLLNIDPKRYYELEEQASDSILDLRLKTIAKYSKYLTIEQVNILKANSFGLKDYPFHRGLNLKLSNSSHLSLYYNSNRFKFADFRLLEELSEREIISSPNYIDNLFYYLFFKNYRLIVS
ncbi:MAG: hypothetical protein EOO99_11565, partial [Pedobacter sp.]